MVEPQTIYTTNTYARRFTQPFLIAFTVLALFVGVLVLVSHIFVGLPWLATWPLIFFVCLEGVYTTLWLAHPQQRRVVRIEYRVAEGVVLALVVRLYTWFLLPQSLPLVSHWTEYIKRPFSLFDDLFFIVTLGIGLVAWFYTISYAHLFNALAVSEGEAHYHSLPPALKQTLTHQRPILLNRAELVEKLSSQWLWGGVILTVCAAMVSFNLQEVTFKNLFSLPRLGIPAEVVAALVLYFLAGFGLLSQGRLALVNSRWLMDGVAKSPAIERSWQRYSLWLVGGAAVVAAFLPIGSTLAIGRILQLLIGGIILIVNLFAALLTALMLLVLSLFGRPAETYYQDEAIQIEQLIPQEPVAPVILNETSGWVPGIFFWVFITVLVVVAIWFFLHDRGFSFNSETIAQFWQTVTAWWRAVWRGVARQAASVRQTIERVLKRPSSAPNTPPWKFIRLNALSPREQIRYFYLAAVRRAGEQGVERQPAETPLEFTQDLANAWPEAKEDVDLLTDAFLAARYSPQPIEKTAVNPIKAGWKRLKNRFRQ